MPIIKNNIRNSFLSCIGFSAVCLTANAQTTKPNIVFILSDDLGYGDVKFFNQNSKIETPNIDLLAKEGVALSTKFRQVKDGQ